MRSLQYIVYGPNGVGYIPCAIIQTFLFFQLVALLASLRMYSAEEGVLQIGGDI